MVLWPSPILRRAPVTLAAPLFAWAGDVFPGGLGREFHCLFCFIRAGGRDAEKGRKAWIWEGEALVTVLPREPPVSLD